MCSNCGIDSCGCAATIQKGDKGDSSKVYIGYATNSSGAGFSLTDGSLPYIGFFSADPTYTPVAADFTGLWYRRSTNFSYIASADDAAGTGFTYPQNVAQSYIGIITSPIPLTPVVGDFAGTWRKIKGSDGLNSVIILYNNLAQTDSGDTSGISVLQDTQVIPAGRMANNGDSVNIQVAMSFAGTNVTNPPYAFIMLGQTPVIVSISPFSLGGNGFVCDITVDRKSSTEYVITKKNSVGSGLVGAGSQLITGVNFGNTIPVTVYANTNANGGGIILNKHYADYKSKV